MRQEGAALGEETYTHGASTDPHSNDYWAPVGAACCCVIVLGWLVIFLRCGDRQPRVDGLGQINDALFQIWNGPMARVTGTVNIVSRLQAING